MGFFHAGKAKQTPLLRTIHAKWRREREKIIIVFGIKLWLSKKLNLLDYKNWIDSFTQNGNSQNFRCLVKL